MRSSAGSAELDWDSVPVQDNATLTYTQVFTNETGIYVFSVRAVDSSGLEESNISQMVVVPISKARE